MQPIHYSFLFNLIVLGVFALLAWRFEQPLLVVVAFLVIEHVMARFPKGDDEDDEGDDGPRPIGFTATL